MDLKVAKKILQAIHSNPTYWHNLKNLNSANTRYWDNVLYEIIKLSPLHGTRHRDIVETVKLLTQMWDKGLAPILIHLEKKGISALQFFQIEKYICFNLATMIHDLNMVNIEVFKSQADASPFAVRAAHCFLPVHVYQLEEYGLPRMVSRKIHRSGKIDLVSTELSIHEVLNKFIEVGVEQLHSIPDVDEFDKFVISHFMDGIN